MKMERRSPRNLRASSDSGLLNSNFGGGGGDGGGSVGMPTVSMAIHPPTESANRHAERMSSLDNFMTDLLQTSVRRAWKRGRSRGRRAAHNRWRLPTGERARPGWRRG